MSRRSKRFSNASTNKISCNGQLLNDLIATVCSSVTNVTFFVNKIRQHPIGCVGVSLPTYVKRNKAIVALEKDKHGKPYLDNVCLFRCLGLHLGRDAMDVYAEYTDQPDENVEVLPLKNYTKSNSFFGCT